MVIKVYWSSISGNQEIKKQQQRIEMILDGKMKDKYEKVDIAAFEDKKKLMRDLIGDQTALPPQIFNDNVYCGNFDEFEAAVEEGTLDKFLKV